MRISTDIRKQRERREFGASFFTDTSTHTGRWCEIEVIEAATFDTLTFEGQSGTWTGQAFPVGCKLLGIFTVIDMASGKVIAVNADAQRATLSTSLTGNNNDLDYSTLKAGSAGNGITIAYVDPAANDATLSVTVAGSAITVNLATNGGGSITSTAALIAAAIQASEKASNLVTVANKSGNDGTGVVTALTATALAGGAG